MMVASKFIQRMEVGISLHRLIYVRFVLFERSHIIICAQTANKKKKTWRKLTMKKKNTSAVTFNASEKKKSSKKVIYEKHVCLKSIHSLFCACKWSLLFFSLILMAFFTSHYYYYLCFFFAFGWNQKFTQ